MSRPDRDQEFGRWFGTVYITDELLQLLGVPDEVMTGDGGQLGTALLDGSPGLRTVLDRHYRTEWNDNGLSNTSVFTGAQASGAAFCLHIKTWPGERTEMWASDVRPGDTS